MGDYTTIAITKDDKKLLDEANERFFDGNASYREVILELISREEEQYDSIDEVLAHVFERVDETRVKQAMSRQIGERKMVEELANGN